LSYDVVIIGSGFGGAVSACRLANAGHSVLVLERGRRWTPQTYPRQPEDAWVWEQSMPEVLNGWIDLRFLKNMWVAQGAGVGGGSLIYANISINAKPQAFDAGWPSQINYGVLEPYYERVRDMLDSKPLPDGQLTKRFLLMREAAEKAGYADRFRKLDLAVTFDEDFTPDPAAIDSKNSKTWTNRFGKQQGTCYHCGNCDIGCDVSARNTLDLNYIADAERAGATVQPLSMVTHISRDKDGWRVHYDRLQNGRREPAEVFARRVVLGAGSLGSTEILLRSRDQYGTLPDLCKSLGRGWSSNGDFLTPAFYGDGRRVDPTIGPTITCAIDFLDGSKDGARFFVEDGGFPKVFYNYLAAKLKQVGKFGPRARFLRHLLSSFDVQNPLSNMMPWFGQGVDAADGDFYLARRWYAPWQRYLELDWDATESEHAVNGLVNMHKELSKATGGEAVVPLTWTVLRMLVTPHPLGGCGMAASPSAGVVDHAGRVFGHPGLYVLDGSIVPRPLGLNPSKTIAALAERGVELMMKE
jgi:cholesterol oxidase